MGCWFFTCVCVGGVLLLPKSHLIICLVNEVEHLWSPQQRTSCQSRTGSWFRETPGPPGSELQVLQDLSSLQREHISPNSLAEIAPADGISASLLTLDEDQTPVVRALQTHWAAVKWNKKDFFSLPHESEFSSTFLWSIWRYNVRNARWKYFVLTLIYQDTVTFQETLIILNIFLNFIFKMHQVGRLCQTVGEGFMCRLSWYGCVQIISVLWWWKHEFWCHSEQNQQFNTSQK